MRLVNLFNFWFSILHSYILPLFSKPGVSNLSKKYKKI